MILARPTRRRRMSLTPMIDVVFLLLVFFMLAARFGIEGTIQLGLGGGSAAYEGPPRLLDIYPDEVRLNGIAVTPDALIPALDDLTVSSSDIIVLRTRKGADVQRLIDLIENLSAAGFNALVLSE